MDPPLPVTQPDVSIQIRNDETMARQLQRHQEIEQAIEQRHQQELARRHTERAALALEQQRENEVKSIAAKKQRVSNVLNFEEKKRKKYC